MSCLSVSPGRRSGAPADVGIGTNRLRRYGEYRKWKFRIVVLTFSSPTELWRTACTIRWIPREYPPYFLHAPKICDLQLIFLDLFFEA